MVLINPMPTKCSTGQNLLNLDIIPYFVIRHFKLVMKSVDFFFIFLHYEAISVRHSYTEGKNVYTSI
jgi:hypothetical protein